MLLSINAYRRRYLLTAFSGVGRVKPCCRQVVLSLMLLCVFHTTLTTDYGYYWALCVTRERGNLGTVCHPLSPAFLLPTVEL